MAYGIDFQKKTQRRQRIYLASVIRIKGCSTICETFERKQEAKDWAQDTERNIKSRQFKFENHKKQHIYADLMRQMESVSTINRYMTVLSSTLNYGVKRLRWLTENPCAHLLSFKESPGRDRVLSDAELLSLLEAGHNSKSPYLYLIVLISLTTGARQGEILGLEWNHVDFENQLAQPKETKNGKPRSVAIAEPVLMELKKLHEKRNPKKPLVFASKTTFGKIDIKKDGKQL